MESTSAVGRQQVRSAVQDGLYYPSFDYLRIVLATVVAVAHSGLPIWSNAGALSVQVFFAMSGWLIGGILLKSEPAQLSKFYFNRSTRIWIPYFVALGLLTIVSLMHDHLTPKWFEMIFYKATFVYNFFGPSQLAQFGSQMPLQGTGNHFWSICAEEQFYLLAPLLITVLPGRIGKTIWFWAFLAAALATSAYGSFFTSISLGVLAATIRVRFGDWHVDLRARAALFLLVLVAFGLTYCGAIAFGVGAPIIALSTVLLVAQPGSHSPFAAFLGGISYPMYLNHWLGVFVANALFQRVAMRGTIWCQLSGVIFALGIAAILYLLVDQVVRAKRDSYFTAQRGKAAAIIGLASVIVGLIVGALFLID